MGSHLQTLPPPETVKPSNRRTAIMQFLSLTLVLSLLAVLFMASEASPLFFKKKFGIGYGYGRPRYYGGYGGYGGYGYRSAPTVFVKGGFGYGHGGYGGGY